MSLRYAFTAILAVFAFSAPSVDGSIVVSITEVGGNVVMSYDAGTLDTTGLTIDSFNTALNILYTGTANAIGGGETNSVNRFTNGVSSISVTESSGWTLTGLTTSWSSTSGTGSLAGAATYAASPNPALWIKDDTSVVGVNNLSAFSGTINGATFVSLGLIGNESIRFSWAADSLTFQTSAVPEPTSFTMFTVAMFGMARRRRKR